MVEVDESARTEEGVEKGADRRRGEHDKRKRIYRKTKKAEFGSTARWNTKERGEGGGSRARDRKSHVNRGRGVGARTDGKGQGQTARMGGNFRSGFEERKRGGVGTEVQENYGDMARSMPVPTQRTHNKFPPVARPPHAHRAIAFESPKPMSTPSYRLRSTHLPMLSTPRTAGAALAHCRPLPLSTLAPPTSTPRWAAERRAAAPQRISLPPSPADLDATKRLKRRVGAADTTSRHPAHGPVTLAQTRAPASAPGSSPTNARDTARCTCLPLGSDIPRRARERVRGQALEPRAATMPDGGGEPESEGVQYRRYRGVVLLGN
ncbi:hypothetical protein B0H13DRAFT_2282228 [Mycena leptocephala]|nr:hypothetical protein B0H13DRAFT_2282228 [Mycena leptocephala]